MPMSPRLGLDFSSGRPSGLAIRQAGYSFVVRYLANGLSGRNNIDGNEVRDLQANGVDISLVWERKLIGQPDRATEGWSAGVADAKYAQVQADSIGLSTHPVYMAVDFDVPDYAPGNPDPRAKLGPVGDYLAGAQSVLGTERMGVYGGYYAVSRALDAGLAHWSWQTAAWSGGKVDTRINLFQRIGTVWVAGVGCDENEARQDAFGQNVEDDVSWTDKLSPNGLLRPDGTQVTEMAMDFLGYADEFARQGKEAAVANGAMLQAIMTKLDVEFTADQQRDAQILAQLKALPVVNVDKDQLAAALTASGFAESVVKQLLDLLTAASQLHAQA